MTVAGFGFRRGATLASLRDALARALAAARPALHDPAITLLATAHDKADAPCLRALSAELGLPVIAIAADHAAATATLTRSEVVQALRGTGSTAEATALAAARIHGGLHGELHGGPAAALSHARSVSADRLATCAIAVLPSLTKDRS